MEQNVSQDLIWEIVNKHNAYKLKQRSGGRVILSRDPLNLTNKHSRKFAGFATDQGIGVQAPPPSKDGPSSGVVLLTKNPKKSHQPVNATSRTQFSGQTSSRKTYRGIVGATAKRGYRPDLRGEAVARASAIKRSQGKERVIAEKKPRGKKAKKAAEKSVS